MKVLVVNGPNLNMLGQREPGLYGTETLAELEKDIRKRAGELGLDCEIHQSNNEGELVEFIQKNGPSAQWLIINAGAYTHTSIAIRDAVLSVKIKMVEVHISNIFGREEFRKTSYLSDIAQGVVSGLGTKGYLLALEYIAGT